MYKLVIFDMDGTILDSDLVLVMTWTSLFKEFTPTNTPSLNQIMSFSGPPLVDSLKKTFPDVPVEYSKKRYMEVSHDFYYSYAKSYPGCKEVIEELRKRGIKVAVNTNKTNNHAWMSLEILGFDKLFDSVVSGGDVKSMKPDPEGVYMIMEQLGITDKSEVLYVGDSYFDYATAENAGIDCIISTLPPRKGIRNSGKLTPKYWFNGFEEFFDVLEGTL